MDRRKFLHGLLQRMSVVVGGYPLANHLLGSDGWAALTRSQAEEKSTGTVAGPVKYPGEGATLEGYLAKPGSDGPHPAVLLIHSNSGLDEPIRKVARRYAEEGSVALTVDPLSRRGGTASFGSPDAVRQAICSLMKDEVHADRQAALAYLQSNPSVQRDRIDVTDCSSGGNSPFPRLH